MKMKKLFGLGIFFLLFMSLLGLFFRPQRAGYAEAYHQGYAAGVEAMQTEDGAPEGDGAAATEREFSRHGFDGRHHHFGPFAFIGFFFRFLITLFFAGLLLRFLFGRRWRRRHAGGHGPDVPPSKWVDEDEPIIKM